MRNRIGKSERRHRISEIELGNPKGGIAFLKSNWEFSWAAIAFSSVSSGEVLPKETLEVAKVTCPPHLEKYFNWPNAFISCELWRFSAAKGIFDCRFSFLSLLNQMGEANNDYSD
jgi:hypothetical protein